MLEHPLQVATLPIDELATAAGVSVATETALRARSTSTATPLSAPSSERGFESLVAPVERLGGNLEHPTTVAEVFATALDESRRNIEATRQSLDYAACEAAVQRILKARSIYIGGFGASAWLAGLLHTGSTVRATTCACSPRERRDAFGALADALGSAGPFIGLTFPRYLTDTVALAQIARSQGCAVLALTDRPSSPSRRWPTWCSIARPNSYRPNCETSVLR